MTRFRIRRSRRGLSLLEVLLSIAILGGAMATIGELIRVGARSAARARDMTNAQLLAEMKMAEITVGVTPLVSQNKTAFEFDAEWLYSIQVEPIDTEGLQSVALLVEKDEPPEMRGASYTLVRWVREADLDFTSEEEEASDEASSGSSGAVGGGSSGAASGGSSGATSGSGS